MIITKKNRHEICKYLFQEGVLYAKKDYNLAKHPEIDVPNLQVNKLMQSFKSREYVTETFAWMDYYWFLTNKKNILPTKPLVEYLISRQSRSLCFLLAVYNNTSLPSIFFSVLTSLLVYPRIEEGEMHAKTDSEGTSLDPSSPTRSPLPAGVQCVGSKNQKPKITMKED